MAKRRSSTRVGRNHPRPALPAPLTGLPLPTRFRATAPVMLDGTLYRVIETPSLQRVVQEWTAGYWIPSLLPLYRVADAMLATPEQLRRVGVPPADWTATPNGMWHGASPLTSPSDESPMAPDDA